MPELPEVETTVRGVRPDLEGRTITNVWLDWPKGLIGPAPEHFMERLKGQTVKNVTRRAKYIVIQLDADYLLIHLKMTGRIYVVPDESQEKADQWVHFKFQLDNAHQLRFSDSRKFGRVYLVENLEEITGELGPEPLSDEFTLAVFRERLAKRKGVIKPLLLNQAFVAGVGNIYADEALHIAHIHPTRTAETLTPTETEALWKAIRQTLANGIEREGASINWYRKPDGSKGSAQKSLLAYGQTGQPCQTCRSGIIEKIVLGQRGTHFCPNCQK
jgi:formamidopyrimidine-DNA glycosylase